jgi:hypothetical protein
VVPVLAEGPDYGIVSEVAFDYLRSYGSALVPGWKTPEGFVVRELMTGASWKRTDAPTPKGPKDRDGNAAPLV